MFIAWCGLPEHINEWCTKILKNIIWFYKIHSNITIMILWRRLILWTRLLFPKWEFYGYINLGKSGFCSSLSSIHKTHTFFSNLDNKPIALYHSVSQIYLFIEYTLENVSFSHFLYFFVFIKFLVWTECFSFHHQ